MKVLVCGSRNFNDAELLADVLSQFDISEIIEGEARGVDSLARDWAELHAKPVRKFPADWDQFGRSAGPIRNTQMLREGRPDLVIAFLAADSKGTKDMITQATIAGVDVHIVNID